MLYYCTVVVSAILLVINIESVLFISMHKLFKIHLFPILINTFGFNEKKLDGVLHTGDGRFEPIF